ncbi:MAG: aldehyde ferredoxin oxidoreductase family protein [Candidatus Bathyarchaeota archaeon]|nr:aldehyde ferredoxin oxidoreductase family protein [Candidatus Bathyarchaeota archaeon]
MTADLTTRRFTVEDRADLFQYYIGGAGVAINLLRENCPEGADPLGSDNPIVFAVGPLVGLYPLASKTVAMFKSPLTGNLGESHAGGRSAVAIRSAGYGAIVIQGASESPVYLSIDTNGVNFRDASGIWGIASSITTGRIIRELETGAGTRTIMRIGGAGERLVRYASVITETYRHFGRLGLGAVFGSKKLKAVTVTGNHGFEVSDRRLYREVYDDIYKRAVESPVMKKYHDIGTASNIMPLNLQKGLPMMNLKTTSSSEAERISGEKLAENYLGRRVACAHCPVACIHIAALREPYEKEPYFYKTTMIPYDYELIYALGSMLGVFDEKAMLHLIDDVEIWGLDAMSTGVVLAWATEAQEKGLITQNETLGLNLRWGDRPTYAKAVEYIVKQPNEFYLALAQGVDKASTLYGGADFALAFGGNEMPGYHTGPVSHIGYLTGARHSHLDAAGYSIDQAALKEKLPDPKAAATKLLKEEAWRQILSSLVVCFFARGIYDKDTVLKTLETAGHHKVPPESLDKLGVEILREKNRFKEREGFKPRELRIPRRIFETPSPLGKVEEKFIRESVEEFYRLLYT